MTFHKNEPVVTFFHKTDLIFSKLYLCCQWFHIGSSTDLDKKCTQLSDTTPSHEILRKIYFDVKPLKRFEEGGEILSALFCKKCPLLISDTAPIFQIRP